MAVAVPNPVQRRALAELRAVVGLLRKLRVEVCRYEFHGADADGILRTDISGAPRELQTCLRDSFWDVIPDDWQSTEGAINFDTFTGRVDIYRHGEGVHNLPGGYFRSLAIPAWPADPPPPVLPEEIVGMLDSTLRVGGIPGVLADWIEDHSPRFPRFAAALRNCRSPRRYTFNHSVNFRCEFVTPDVMFWAACSGEDKNESFDDPARHTAFGISSFDNPLSASHWDFAVDAADGTRTDTAVWLDLLDPHRFLT